MFSDYCIGDPNKSNDTFAFAIVLNHDTQSNIEEYIAAVAPSDIKGSRSSSQGLIEYLRCPVVFSVSYLVDKKSKLLRDCMTDDNIRGALQDMREVVAQMASMIPEKVDCYRAVDRRLASFQTEMKRRSPNSNLAQQILLCAAFASIVCRHLAVKKKPRFIRWISDRDAMFDKHEITRWPVDMETKGDADFFVFIELDLRTMAPTFYVLTNAQARATFRDYIGGGNCYPGEVRKLIRPNDFSALLPTPEAVISEFQ